MSKTAVTHILHRIAATDGLPLYSRHCRSLSSILRQPYLKRCVHHTSQSSSRQPQSLAISLNSTEGAFNPRSSFRWAVLGGLLLGSAAAVRAYCRGAPVQAAWITTPPEPELYISQCDGRTAARVTFDLPAQKHFQRIFLRLNHCVTNGGDAADIFINSKPLRLHCQDVPVFDYEEQELWIPRELCRPGHNVVKISLGEGHRGEYWLLDASVDAYEEGPVLIFRARTSPGGKAPSLAAKLIM